MTSGHKHRIVTVKDKWLIRFLTKPRIYSSDMARVDASPYPWGPDTEATTPTYYLSILSILHRWTGLTLNV